LSLKVAVVVFPGTNCEHDVARALGDLGASCELVFHDRSRLAGFDAVVLPGGFAHGDYLRPGAIARFSPVMGEVRRLAGEGAPVLGICNGFQVLTEAGLLPGALQRNAGLRFVCRPVRVRIESRACVLTRHLEPGTVLRIPVNHMLGNYVCEPATLAELRAESRIVARYVDNPNGSLDDIAGVCNRQGNVVGLMPHPERACDPLLGPPDGRLLLEGLLGARAPLDAGLL
jgi:phosphoribosylformylglycinamidine synthase I